MRQFSTPLDLPCFGRSPPFLANGRRGGRGGDGGGGGEVLPLSGCSDEVGEGRWGSERRDGWIFFSLSL